MTHPTTSGSRTQCKFSFRRELLPPARSFYEKELGKLSRPSRGWVRGRCPFHQSKSGLSFSMNLDSGGFYCHGCQVKGGDLVDFVKLRDRVDFRRAAQLLGAWREEDLSEAERRDLQRQKLERERSLLRSAIADASAHRTKIEARDHLHCLERIYKEANVRLTQLSRGDPEQFDGERESCWELMANSLPLIRQTDAEYRRLAGLENPYA